MSRLTVLLGVGLSVLALAACQRTPKHAPPPSRPLSAVALFAGPYTTCARLADGDVYCWGSDPTAMHVPVLEQPLSPSFLKRPTAIPFLRGADEVALALAHGCARFGGEVRCWGRNPQGQLGDGSEVDRATPVPVRLAAPAKHVVTAALHSCALLENGQVECWGEDTCAQVGPHLAPHGLPVIVAGVEDAVEIEVSETLSCARKRDGSVRCWGELRHGGPGKLVLWQTPTEPAPTLRAAQLALGDEHLCARDPHDRVSCWGNDAVGQLGDGGGAPKLAPSPVAGLDAAAQIAAGYQHTCAILSDGTVRCFGANEHAELGNGAPSPHGGPSSPLGLTEVVQLALGNEHSCALRRDHSVWCWGDIDLDQQPGQMTWARPLAIRY
jgi:alpha-tubulin suppressor-like RCC1 family protein